MTGIFASRAGSVSWLAHSTLLLLATWLLGAPVRAADSLPAPGASAVDSGRYLAQIGNCVSCHTAPGGIPFAGGGAFQSPYAFLGTIYSSNITADEDTGLGRWTLQDFAKAMRQGTAPDGKHLFPVFPYPSFTRLSDADLAALYAYVRTLAAVRVVAPTNSFWFRQRWAMPLWNILFLDSGPRPDDVQRSADWNRGRYLVQGLGHCGACHTPRNLALAERQDATLTGGVEIDEVTDAKQRLWSAPNLTSTDSGLIKWSAEELARYLKNGSSRRAGAYGPMNEVIANSLRYLTDGDARAMSAYLKARPGVLDSARQRRDDAQHGGGPELYAKHCEECHLPTGRGGFRKAPPLSGNPVVQSKNPASLLNVIIYGARPASDLPNTVDAWEEMPGFGDKMSDQEIAQLVNYLRSEWDNIGDEVITRSVSAQR